MRTILGLAAVLTAALSAASAAELAPPGEALRPPTTHAGMNAPPSGWFGGPADGWFFYQEDPEPEEEEELEPVPVLPAQTEPSPSPLPGPPAYTTAWIRDNLPLIRDRAIDDPSPDNVRSYMYVQRLAMDKSSKFADMVQVVTQGNPMLDESMRRPTASFAANAMTARSNIERRKLFAELSKTTGIWYFYRSDCGFCMKESPLLHALEQDFGLTIIPISLDGYPPPGSDFKTPYRLDRGQAAMLNVQGTPATFLVRPGDATVLPLAQGLLSYPQLIERVLVSAYGQGWITREQYQKTRPFENKGPEVGTPEYIQIMDQHLQKTPLPSLPDTISAQYMGQP